ncbi:unnamed protein product [Vitrella brassicaformis CCMP3155]|uniref:Uncharacterized protein n=1 Tax=Vitrella brassicaformis (strain CCMP3155) TaxID=1169540 RepID=A0A0G4GK20_VITBC|nr:unnamed protein product [Vitrella brassicaformis CCMP3155]|eukprot:CEM30279.1 unnamed protein product [Vitrella brassicaformis CCMP3155]
MGNTVPRKTSDEASPSIHGQCLDFIRRDDRYQLYDEAKDIGRLRTAARFVGNDHFPAQTLRERLKWSLHRTRLADGSRLDTVIAFDPQSVTEARLLLAAMWMVEKQRWEEVAEVLRWASQCGCCTLPVNVTADDINKHADKTAYVSIPRVLAQLMVVGRHIDFGDGSRLQLFRHGHEVRAIKDQPGFRLPLNPPLPPGDPHHRLHDDPPVHSRIYYDGCRWRTGVLVTYASVSSHVGGGRVDALLTQSPHTPVAGCSTTFCQDGDRYLVLTNSTHTFVAWIVIINHWGTNNVGVVVWTTEAPVSAVGGALKDRFPETTALARVALGAVGPYVFDGQPPPPPQQPQQPQPQPQQQGGDDGTTDGDVGDGDADDGDMHPNDGQEASRGSDEYSE